MNQRICLVYVIIIVHSECRNKGRDVSSSVRFLRIFSKFFRNPHCRSFVHIHLEFFFIIPSSCMDIFAHKTVLQYSNNISIYT